MLLSKTTLLLMASTLIVCANPSCAGAQTVEAAPASLDAPDPSPCLFAGFWTAADDVKRGILELTVDGQHTSGKQEWIVASGWGLGSGHTIYNLRVIGSGSAEGSETIYTNGTPVVVSGTTKLTLIDARTLRMETQTAAYVEQFFIKLRPKLCRP